MYYFEMRMQMFGHYHAIWRTIRRCEESDFESFDDFNHWLAFMQARRDYVLWILFKDFNLVGRSATYMGV